MKFNISFKKSISRWPRRDLMIFFETLESYVSAGISLDRALDIIAVDSVSKKKKAAIIGMKSMVESGSSLSKALSEYVHLSGTSRTLIFHAESTGELSGALSRARIMLERQDDLIKKCLGALMYPVVIGIVALLLTFGLVRGVMPQIIPMLQSLHATLPLVTRIVMRVSDVILKYGLHIFVSTMFIFVASLMLYNKVYVLRKIFHLIVLRIPIIGRLCIAYALSNFLRSFGSLVESGISVGDAYMGAIDTIALLPIKELFLKKTKAVAGGSEVATVVSGKRIPIYVPALLSAGEASGMLGMSSIRASEILDRDIENTLKKLTSLIEPLMMVGMGVVVGGIALSIMMPIYDISRVLQK